MANYCAITGKIFNQSMNQFMNQSIYLLNISYFTDCIFFAHFL